MTAQNNILGIHHVTAIAGDPQANIDFYVKVLGLRLVKKTVNFDDPFTYHFYFGDEVGSPGTLLTFFPWSSQAHRGKIGSGQLSVFSFAVPENSLRFWSDRLQRLGIPTSRSIRFGEEVLTAFDQDRFQFELIAARDVRSGWQSGVVSSEFAIRGFHGVTLLEIAENPTADFLQARLAFRTAGIEGNRWRFENGSGGSGTIVDVLCEPNTPRGFLGVGTVHHIAFRTETSASQMIVRQDLVRNGTEVTPVIDRNYFQSIYFREPGGVLFEVATDPPGFLIDEPKDELGTHLKLPSQYENIRSEIERTIPPVHIPLFKKS
ncbi:MAG TPA: ring-cleaving dioxygenase [Bacteroidota bacterium]|nr:ring-cleaving dioxygenase [Bacteroidota bacterium]